MKFKIIFICTFLILVSSCKSQIESEKEADELAKQVSSQSSKVFYQWRSIISNYKNRNNIVIELLKEIEPNLGSNSVNSKYLIELVEKANQVKNIDDTIIHDENKFKYFQELNSNIGAQLSKMLVAAENIKDKRSSFFNLQAQLEGLENHISVNRQQYNHEVQSYNHMIKDANDLFFEKYPHLGVKCYFKAAPGSDIQPKVEF